MKVLDFGEAEGLFGLLVRDKTNHDNYMLLSIENLEEIIKAFDEIKKQFKGDKK